MENDTRNVLILWTNFFCQYVMHSPWLFLWAECQQKGLHQVCSPWVFGSEDLHALVQPTPTGSSYSENVAPLSFQRSGKSWGLERDKKKGKEWAIWLADQFVSSGVRGTGLNCVDEGFFICGVALGFSRSSEPSRMNSLCELYKEKVLRGSGRNPESRGWSTEYQYLPVKKAKVKYMSHSCYHIHIYINMICIYCGFSFFFCWKMTNGNNGVRKRYTTNTSFKVHIFILSIVISSFIDRGGISV